MEFHDAGEAMGMRKILAHDIRVKKKSANQGGQFLDFYRFSWSYKGPKHNFEPPHRNFINLVASYEIVYMLLLFHFNRK